MTRLDCSVMNCMYNEDYSCCRNHIEVEGKDAKEKDGTCCASFREKSGNMQNSVQIPNAELDVNCEATNCKYNHQCKCYADQIGVDGNNACKCHDTMCGTFTCKC